jgi:hypothetical protein
MNMTPEQKQIAIAEFEGWRELRDGRWKIAETGIVKRFPPPYLTSRDAICEVVGKLDDWHKKVFAYTLLSKLESWPEKPSFREGEPLCCEEWTAAEAIKIALATPAQMADALLLTLGHQI